MFFPNTSHCSRELNTAHTFSGNIVFERWLLLFFLLWNKSTKDIIDHSASSAEIRWLFSRRILLSWGIFCLVLLLWCLIDKVQFSYLIFLFESLPLWLSETEFYGGFYDSKILKDRWNFDLLLQFVVSLSEYSILRAFFAAETPAALGHDQFEVKDKCSEKVLIHSLKLLYVRSFVNSTV